MNGIAMLKSANLGIAALLGVALIANGAFMLVAPADWYVAVPGVPDLSISIFCVISG
jgi:hypothetical protein